jgi:hypothetical protein
MMLGFGGSRPDHIRDMITTSTDWAQSIPRSRISKKEASVRIRIWAKLNLVSQHEADVEKLLWLKDAMSIAEDGKGRAEAVDMIIGAERGMQRRRFGNQNRYKTMDKGEVAG